jgi:hypothetical protein
MLVKPHYIALSMTGLIAGNFAYQAMTLQHWAVAAERSLFQLTALVCFVIAGLFP